MGAQVSFWESRMKVEKKRIKLVRRSSAFVHEYRDFPGAAEKVVWHLPVSVVAD